jgi:hypothetical protein
LHWPPLTNERWLCQVFLYAVDPWPPNPSPQAEMRSIVRARERRPIGGVVGIAMDRLWFRCKYKAVYIDSPG